MLLYRSSQVKSKKHAIFLTFILYFQLLDKMFTQKFILKILIIKKT